MVDPDSAASPRTAAAQFAPQSFSREQLGATRLPSAMLAGTVADQLGLAPYFAQVVDALALEGDLAPRDDGTYRLWDVYAIVDGIHAHTQTRIGPPGAPHAFMADGLHARRLAGLREVEERWWEAAESARACARWHVREVGLTVYREGAVEEAARREDAHRVLHEELDRLAGALPAHEKWWTDHLRAHASLALSLGDAGYRALAHDCAVLLELGARLAERRLRLTFRELRERVGVAGTRGLPALTAASPSYRQRAYDVAGDVLEATLPAFNQAADPGLALDQADLTAFLDALTEVGLAQWYVDLAVVRGPGSDFTTLSADLDFGARYARTRSLAGLLEEALLALAARRDAAFGDAVSTAGAGTLVPKLLRYMQGPTAGPPAVPQQALQSAWGAAALRADDDAASVARKLEPLALVRDDSVHGRALRARLEGGDWTRLSQAPSTVQVLAGLVVVRNTTAHRFPGGGIGMPNHWLSEWRRRETAIDRTLAWAGLTLWAIQRAF